MYRSAETHKAALRTDRKIRELEFQGEEEKKKFQKLGEIAEKLQVHFSIHSDPNAASFQANIDENFHSFFFKIKA